MRVALIDSVGQWGGNHYYTDQLARGLAHAGVTVTVYSWGDEADWPSDRPYRYVEAFRGVYGSRHRVIRGLQFLKCLVMLLAGSVRERSDIVHVQVWGHDFEEVLQVGLARLLGKEVVLTVHDGFDRNARNLGWEVACARGIVVHNRFCLDLLTASHRPGCPVVVVPHVNQAGSIGDLPDRWSARRRLDLPQDKMVFLFFGNCRADKGLEIALRAVAELKVHTDDFLLVSAGKMKPKEEEHFRGSVSELNIDQFVRFDVGLIPDNAATDYYRAADAVVIPYLQICESGVAITASTCARAIVASDLPPLLEATENGRLGLHFRRGDSHDLADAMLRAMSMRDELDKLGAQARLKVLEERDPDVIGSKTLALYEQCCQSDVNGGMP